MNRRTFPFFDGYFLQLRLEEMRRSAVRFHGMVQDLLDEAHVEQRARLRAIRQAEPWDAERAVAVRQQADRAAVVILRLRQRRELFEQVRQLEAQLPPRRGWQRLRYWNPWVVTWVSFALCMAVNATCLWLQVSGGG